MNETDMTVIKEQIHENDNYRVNVVRVPDMYFDTYAVINKRTGVIEQIHPNLYNVTKIADQFDRWLTTGPDEAEDMNSLLDSFGFTPNGKAN